jgi:hypothetical protein
MKKTATKVEGQDGAKHWLTTRTHTVRASMGLLEADDNRRCPVDSIGQTAGSNQQHWYKRYAVFDIN